MRNEEDLGAVSLLLSHISKFNNLSFRAIRSLRDLREAFNPSQLFLNQVLLASDYYERPKGLSLTPSQPTIHAAFDVQAPADASGAAVGAEGSAFASGELSDDSSTSGVGFSVPMFDEGFAPNSTVGDLPISADLEDPFFQLQHISVILSLCTINL